MQVYAVIVKVMAGGEKDYFVGFFKRKADARIAMKKGAAHEAGRTRHRVIDRGDIVEIARDEMPLGGTRLKRVSVTIAEYRIEKVDAISLLNSKATHSTARLFYMKGGEE